MRRPRSKPKDSVASIQHNQLTPLFPSWSIPVEIDRCHVFLRRLNDSANEYRGLDVLQDHSKFRLYEFALFASDPEAQRIALTNMDSEQVIREHIRQEIDRLGKEGFAVVRREGSLLEP